MKVFQLVTCRRFSMLKTFSSLSLLVNCRSFWQHVHSVVEKTFANTLTSSIINSFSTIFRDIVIIAFDIDSFVKNHHNYVSELSDEIKYTVNVIVIINFRSSIKSQTRIFRIASIEFSDFSSEWAFERNVFNNAIRQFHEITVEFRTTIDYRSFLSKDEKDNFDSSFNTFVKSMSFITSKRSQIDENVFDASRLVNRFRNENDIFVVEKNQTHIQTYVRLSTNESRVFNYSFITQSNNTVNQFDEQNESNSLNTRKTFAKKVIYSLLIKSNSIVVLMNSTLQAIIIVVVNVVIIQTINDIRAKIRQEIQQVQQNNDQSESFEFSDSSNSFDENNDENSFWRFEDLDFLDIKLSIFFEFDSMIRNDKNVYYRNVHLFCKRIRNLIAIKNEKLIRINLNICLFDYAFIWYISELKTLNRVDLRNLSLEKDWIKKFKLRFKFNHFAVIDAFVFERYILVDVRNDRKSFNYVQQIVNYVMNANFQNTHQQFTWTWKNLDFNLKRDISTSNDITSLTNFLHLIENRKKVWQKLYTRDENRDDRDRRSNNRQINKSSQQDSNRDDHLSFDDVYAFQSQYFFANWYYNSNSVY